VGVAQVALAHGERGEGAKSYSEGDGGDAGDYQCAGRIR
jgi:hypothetical protein